MFSPTDAAFEGFRLTRERPVTVLLGWPLVFLIAFAAIAVALIAAVGPAGLQELQAATASAQASKDPLATVAVLGRMIGVVLILLPLVLLFGAMTYAAVFRAVLRPQEGGFFFFRLGGDELRLLLVNLVLTLVFGVAGVVAVFVIGLLAGVAKAGGGDSAAFLVGLLGGAVFLGLAIWVSMRLLLALPITFAEKRIAIFDSWKLTKGRFWSLFGMVVLTLVFFLIVTFLGGLVSSALVALAGGGFAAIGAVQRPDLTQMTSALALPLGIYAVANLVLSSLQTAIMYAPFAVAYRALKEKA